MVDWAWEVEANAGAVVEAIVPATLRARMAEMTMFLRVRMFPPCNRPRSAGQGWPLRPAQDS
jgi:hypothetical protein